MRTCIYLRAQLTEIQETIVTEEMGLDPITVTSVGIDQRRNVVRVGVLPDHSDVGQRLKDRYGPTVSIEEVQSPQRSDGHRPRSPVMCADALSGAKDASLRDTLVDRLRMRRLGTPDNVASALIFLASPDASWITGLLLRINGGEMDEMDSVYHDL